MRTAEIAAWVNEREAIRLRKGFLEQGFTSANIDPSIAWWGEPDWTLDHLTNDPILQRFRATNVRREDDRVTRWIRENITEPYADHALLWLMLAIARTLNWPPTLKFLMGDPRTVDHPSGLRACWPGHPDFQSENLTAALETWKGMGNKTYTGAYMIRAPSSPSEPWFTWSKQRYIAEIVIGELWNHAWAISHEGWGSSRGMWEWLQQYTGWGPFMSYQLVVDCQHTRYGQRMTDIQTWAAAGPGTLRGLNRWRGEQPNAPLKQDLALELLLALRAELNSTGALAPWVVGPLDLSDVCNVCCEWDKYSRVKNGEGRPRALYIPGRGY
jgi:hypothetical protein